MADAAACGLLSELLGEHLAQDVSGTDDLAALRMFRLVALANRKLFLAGEPAWQGLAFSLLS
jgi:hypothetical protein